MPTRRLDLEKDGRTVTLTQQAHIDAYKAKGWREVVTPPAAPAPRVRKKKEA